MSTLHVRESDGLELPTRSRLLRRVTVSLVEQSDGADEADGGGEASTSTSTSTSASSASDEARPGSRRGRRSR